MKTNCKNSPGCLMAVGAHADDVEFNAGATLTKYNRVGYDIVYVMSTNNMSGLWSTLDASGKRHSRRLPWHEIQPQRKLEAAQAAGYFGATPIHLDHPQRHYTNDDGTVEHLCFGAERPEAMPPGIPTILTAYENETAVNRLADLMLERKPEAVLSHGMETGNIEHIGSCFLVCAAYKRARKAGFEGMLLFWHDITPPPVIASRRTWDTHVDVTGYWQCKLEALALHACQIPNPGVLDLPNFGPACKCEAAEVFTIAERGVPPGHGVTPFSLEIFGNAR